MMISSIRFRNSGRKCWRSTPMTSPLTPLAVALKPIRLCRPMMTSEARFEVAMISELLKSTTRPLPSVRRPSSNTCSSTL